MPPRSRWRSRLAWPPPPRRCHSEHAAHLLSRPEALASPLPRHLVRSNPCESIGPPPPSTVPARESITMSRIPQRGALRARKTTPTFAHATPRALALAALLSTALGSAPAWSQASSSASSSADSLQELRQQLDEMRRQYDARIQALEARLQEAP